jgi:hypothetical protein
MESTTYKDLANSQGNLRQQELIPKDGGTADPPDSRRVLATQHGHRNSRGRFKQRALCAVRPVVAGVSLRLPRYPASAAPLNRLPRLSKQPVTK